MKTHEKMGYAFLGYISIAINLVVVCFVVVLVFMYKFGFPEKCQSYFSLLSDSYDINFEMKSDMFPVLTQKNIELFEKDSETTDDFLLRFCRDGEDMFLYYRKVDNERGEVVLASRLFGVSWNSTSNLPPHDIMLKAEYTSFVRYQWVSNNVYEAEKQ